MVPALLALTSGVLAVINLLGLDDLLAYTPDMTIDDSKAALDENMEALAWAFSSPWISWRLVSLSPLGSFTCGL